MPDYAVISVGAGKSYNDPDKRTLDLLGGKEFRPKVYRTDINGDIIVKSDGEYISVQCSK